jgi:hypothetical protein
LIVNGPREGDRTERSLRVLPNGIDININSPMNNGRFLTLTDRLLFQHVVRCGFARHVLKAGWWPKLG